MLSIHLPNKDSYLMFNEAQHICVRCLKIYNSMNYDKQIPIRSSPKQETEHG